MCMLKSIVRVGLIVALAGGAAFAIVGPHRARAMFDQARSGLNNQIDKMVDDPVAMRAQLRELEAEYPSRIAEVRGELEELIVQISQLEHERDVSRRVVELAQTGLDEIKPLLSRAEDARGDRPYASISVRYENRTMSIDQAYAQATEFTNTLAAHATKEKDITRDLTFLAQQRDRLEKLHEQLANEHAQFRTQLAQLDGQIDMVARNDKLIGMLERRQKTIDQLSRYESVSLEQFSGKMARIRAEQESRLEALSRSAQVDTLEKQAEQQIRAEQAARAAFENSQKHLPSGESEECIEIGPESCDEPSAGVASAESTRIVID